MIQEREIFIALMSIQNFEENCKKEGERKFVGKHSLRAHDT
jgi:hypothetical protein